MAARPQPVRQLCEHAEEPAEHRVPGLCSHIAVSVRIQMHVPQIERAGRVETRHDPLGFPGQPAFEASQFHGTGRPIPGPPGGPQ